MSDSSDSPTGPTAGTDQDPERSISRRSLLTGAASAAGGALLARIPLEAQQATTPAPTPPADPTKVLGAPTAALSSRSPLVTPVKSPTGQVSGGNFTPLHQLTGSITPADLQFERHHGGVPAIDP